MAEEQSPQGLQDPVQSAAEPAQQTAPVQQQTPPTPQPQQQLGPSPWADSLQQGFSPDEAAKIDAWARQNVQPYVTRLEQQYAETAGARQMVEAFERDPDAANVAVQRQLYGDQYADEFAAALGRTDLIVQQIQQQPIQQQYQQPVQQQYDLPPEYRQALDTVLEDQRDQQYREARDQFLSDPQYADINAELFDGFVQNAETWEDAVNAYRGFAAEWERTHAPQQQQTEQPQAPPVMGSAAQGGVGSTPTYPKETVDQAIDAIFGENKPIAPPVIGG